MFISTLFSKFPATFDLLPSWLPPVPSGLSLRSATARRSRCRKRACDRSTTPFTLQRAVATLELRLISKLELHVGCAGGRAGVHKPPAPVLGCLVLGAVGGETGRQPISSTSSAGGALKCTTSRPVGSRRRIQAHPKPVSSHPQPGLAAMPSQPRSPDEGMHDTRCPHASPPPIPHRSAACLKYWSPTARLRVSHC